MMPPPEKVSVPATSITTIPPVLPFQAWAVIWPVTVALSYCGTRTAWKRRWPWVAVALALV